MIQYGVYQSTDQQYHKHTQFYNLLKRLIVSSRKQVMAPCKKWTKGVHYS